ncbi:MAG: hypothetical protein HC875_39010 [Anaerolineales bacterium]|nr:hypothetical protein [Anaerolineales bacterium]
MNLYKVVCTGHVNKLSYCVIAQTEFKARMMALNETAQRFKVEKSIIKGSEELKKNVKTNVPCCFLIEQGERML